MFKSQKLTKSRKKMLKCENSPKFSAKKSGSNFLTFGAKETFNRL